jgi:hypothetical protein
LIEQCARSAECYLSFSGLLPREGIAREHQLDAFADRLVKQTASPQVVLDGRPMLGVTGGVPGYLEQLIPTRDAEENIERLCFNQGVMLFHECEQIFHDIFSSRAATCRDIVGTLVAGPQDASANQWHLETGTWW